MKSEVLYGAFASLGVGLIGMIISLHSEVKSVNDWIATHKIESSRRGEWIVELNDKVENDFRVSDIRQGDILLNEINKNTLRIDHLNDILLGLIKE
jgi:hypothetical protein